MLYRYNHDYIWCTIYGICDINRNHIFRSSIPHMTILYII